MRHVTHQMTKLILGHKDACKSRLVLNLSQAKRIECAVRAVIKLICTDVSCEWVSCLLLLLNLHSSYPRRRLCNLVKETCSFRTGNHSTNKLLVLVFSPLLLILLHLMQPVASLLHCVLPFVMKARFLAISSQQFTDPPTDWCFAFSRHFALIFLVISVIVFVLCCSLIPSSSVSPGCILQLRCKLYSSSDE